MNQDDQSNLILILRQVEFGAVRFQKLKIGSMRSETLMFLLVSVRGVGRRGELGDNQGSFYMLIILYEPMIHLIPFGKNILSYQNTSQVVRFSGWVNYFHKLNLYLILNHKKN